MLIPNKGEIEIKVEGVELNTMPSNYTFTIRDSIHKLYPTLLMQMNDMTGQYHEYMVFMEGTNLELSYILEEQKIKCPYTVIKNSVPNQEIQNAFGGEIEISGVHEYFYTQNLLSKSYEGEISAIIEELTNKYSFNRKGSHIEGTNSRGMFYQPLKNDADFMVNQLLPLSYSIANKKEPYYLFINTNNEIHLETYTSMMSKTEAYPISLGNASSLDSVSNNFALGVFTKQIPLAEIRHTLNQNIFYFDSESNQVQNDLLITDILENSFNTIPIKANLDNITNYQELYDEDFIDDNAYMNEGLLNSRNRNAFSIDKIVLTMNLNLTMIAGKKIELNISNAVDKEQGELSSRNSGSYIIESTYHSWNSRSGNTIIVAFRQSTKIPTNYRNKKITVTGGR
jgi:hypothetical protein